MGRQVKKSSARRTIFDDVFRTMAVKMPWLIIPVINELFGTHYDEDETVTQLRNELMERNGMIITDMILQIRGEMYHVESQSRKDNRMEIRMFSYDVAVALEHAGKEDDLYTVRFPESCVLYVNKVGDLPGGHTVRVIFPGGDTMDYTSQIVRIQDYDIDEIFEKKLLMFLPFYITRYSGQFAAIEKSREKYDQLASKMISIRDRLAETVDTDEKSDLYDNLINLLLMISDHVLKDRATLKKEVTDIMGGKVLTLPSDKIRRAEKKAMRDGMAQGMAQGMAEGMAQGMAEGMAQGEIRKLISLVCCKIKKGKVIDVIANELEDSVESIRPVYEASVAEAPGYDIDKIYKRLNSHASES